jgi:hypothetical protein
MTSLSNSVHPEGELNLPTKSDVTLPIEVDTFDGKVHIEWDPDAAVTSLGQLPFFIQFLKLGQRFDPWVDSCPLAYHSNNASSTRDILGSIFLSVLSGHTRYAHIGALIHDRVNTQLLGMNKVVSDDTVRRALQNIDEVKGIEWLQSHLLSSYEGLLSTSWILDTDVTIKPLYGHQEAAIKGYNPHKPSRPSHTFHTYMIANLRLILEVDVLAGNQSGSSYSPPGLMDLLNKLPITSRPAFVRGDCDWGSGNIMGELEQQGYHYLFKMRKSKQVKELIYRHHGKGLWHRFKPGWEAKEASLTLSTWYSPRRVVLVRRQLARSEDLVIEHRQDDQMHLSFIDEPENINAFEYSVLVTNLDDDVLSIVQHYRDRADCENNFDELKNQWGWGGFTTKQVKSCRFISRIIALVYNWWTLYTRLLLPGSHREAITSRPLLLSSVGRLSQSGRQKKISITSSHHLKETMLKAYKEINPFFIWLKATAPQLSISQCWQAILNRIIEMLNDNNDAIKSELAEASP